LPLPEASPDSGVTGRTTSERQIDVVSTGSRSITNNDNVDDETSRGADNNSDSERLPLPEASPDSGVTGRTTSERQIDVVSTGSRSITNNDNADDEIPSTTAATINDNSSTTTEEEDSSKSQNNLGRDNDFAIVVAATSSRVVNEAIRESTAKIISTAATDAAVIVNEGNDSIENDDDDDERWEGVSSPSSSLEVQLIITPLLREFAAVTVTNVFDRALSEFGNDGAPLPAAEQVPASP